MGKEIEIKTKDGLKLFGMVDAPDTPKAVIVIVHGLAEHLNRYDAITEYLVKNQLAVVRYDQRGHAHSEGKKVYLSNYNELPDDVLAAVEVAKEEFPDLPVYLIGHSMGGFSVTAFGTKYPNLVNGIIMSGAVTRMKNSPFHDIPKELSNDDYLPNELGGKVCTDISVVEEYSKDPLVAKEIAVGLIRSLLIGIEYLKENARNFVVPTLILHGNEDGLVEEKDSRDLFGDIGTIDKKLIIYPKLYHEIFNEPCKEDIYGEIVTWIYERI